MFADGESPSYSINRWLPNANDLKGKTDRRIDSFREEFHSCLCMIESDGRAISSHPGEDSTHSIRRVEFIHAIASSSQRNHTIHHRFVESLAVPLDNLPAIHSFSFSLTRLIALMIASLSPTSSYLQLHTTGSSSTVFVV